MGDASVIVRFVHHCLWAFGLILRAFYPVVRYTLLPPSEQNRHMGIFLLMNLNETDAKMGGQMAVPWGSLLGLSVFALCFSLGGWVLSMELAKSEEAEGHASGLLSTERVSRMHLRFTSENWRAMEPRGGQSIPGPGPGGRGGVGPADALGSQLMARGDVDGNHLLSKLEFSSLAEKLFQAWDLDHSTTLSIDELRNGFQVLLPSVPPRDPLMADNSQSRRNGLAAMSGLEFHYVQADLSCEGEQLAGVSVRYKGNNTFMMSRNSLKRSLKIDINRGAQGRRLQGLTKLNLHNNVNDPSWMNETLSYRLYRDAGVPAPRTGFALVTVDVPGLHTQRLLGLYSVVENIDGNFARERFGTKRGALFKPSTRHLFEYQGEDWSAYERSYDAKTSLSEEETRHLISFCRLVSQADDAQFEREIERYLDLEAFARYMAVTTWLSTMDSLLSMGQNFVVYLHPKTRQFQFIPWDLDHSFGHFPMAGSSQQLETLSLSHPWAGKNLFLERVFGLERFRRLYLAALSSLNRRLCKPERISAQVDELACVLRPAVAEESAEKLQRFDAQVKGAPQVSSSRRGPGGFSNPIKAFVAVRHASVSAQLTGQITGYVPQNGGPGGGGPPGSPEGGPGRFLAEAFAKKLGVTESQMLGRGVFVAAFESWFDSWRSGEGDAMDGSRLSSGLSGLLPQRGPGAPGGRPAFGPSGGDDFEGPPGMPRPGDDPEFQDP